MPSKKQTEKTLQNNGDPTYNVEVKIFRGSRGSLENAIKSYLNSLSTEKTIRAVTMATVGAELEVLIIHDA